MKNGLRKISKIIRLFLIAFTATVVIIGLFRYFNDTKFRMKVSLVAPLEYSELFNDGAKEKLVLRMSYTSKGRYPFSEYYYERLYSIIVYKIEVYPGNSLKDILRYGNKTGSLWNSKDYTEISPPKFVLYYASDSIPIANNIIIAFAGDSLRTIVNNDYIFAFNLNLKNFSIRYLANDAADIIAAGPNKFSKNVPIGIMFIRKTSGLFLVFVSNITSDEPIEKDFPYKLLNTDH